MTIPGTQRVGPSIRPWRELRRKTETTDKRIFIVWVPESSGLSLFVSEESLERLDASYLLFLCPPLGPLPGLVEVPGRLVYGSDHGGEVVEEVL